MKFEVSLDGHDAFERRVDLPNGRMLLTAGVRSYLVTGYIETPTDAAYIKIGRYSSLAQRIVFSFEEGDHPGRVSNYSFEDAVSSDDVLQPVNEIVIGSDVWIGCDVRIRGGVHIGDGAVIGAGAVVMEDVPPYAVAIGNPAHVMRYRFSQETIACLLQIRWWDWPEDQIRTCIPLLLGDAQAFCAQLSAWSISDGEKNG